MLVPVDPVYVLQVYMNLFWVSKSPGSASYVGGRLMSLSASDRGEMAYLAVLACQQTFHFTIYVFDLHRPSYLLVGIVSSNSEDIALCRQRK